MWSWDPEHNTGITWWNVKLWLSLMETLCLWAVITVNAGFLCIPAEERTNAVSFYHLNSNSHLKRKALIHRVSFQIRVFQRLFNLWCLLLMLRWLYTDACGKCITKGFSYWRRCKNASFHRRIHRLQWFIYSVMESAQQSLSSFF